jgi:hypothetical protein
VLALFPPAHDRLRDALLARNRRVLDALFVDDEE